MIFRSDCTVWDAIQYDSLPENVRMLCDKMLSDREEIAYNDGYSEGRSAGYEQGYVKGLAAARKDAK